MGNRRTQLFLAFLVASLCMLPAPTAADIEVCATPGKDGSLTTLPPGGIVNTYYSSLDPLLTPGSTDIRLGTPTGANATLSAGDLAIVIQMQDADINANNDGRYGDGQGVPTDPNDPGSGSLAVNGSGLYEYIRIDSASVAAGVTTVTFTGKGPSGKLINTYRNEDYVAGDHGRRRYQVVRVPQYTEVNLSAPSPALLTARPWEGFSGGIVAFDVRDAFVTGGHMFRADGTGFRGGAGQRFSGAVSGLNTDYCTFSTVDNNGNKGEGIAGTPRHPFDTLSGKVLDTGVEGYPNGSRARGAPGNAGGGGTDGSPENNTENSGGGGGGNGSVGGRGGNTRSSNLPRGGFGGDRFLSSPARLAMGGGGGGGGRNNSAGDSHGGAGGGILMIRAGSVDASAGGLISANGTSAADAHNNGAGGGGAGGSIVLVSHAGGWSGLTIRARGGRGGDATVGTSEYGPGGGGGGGVILLSGGSISPAPEVTPGNNGIALQGNPYGATTGGTGSASGSPGPDGAIIPFIGEDDIPGVDSGAECFANDPPTAADDVYPTPQDTPISIGPPGVLANDTDPEGQALTAVLVTDSSSGVLALLPTGAFTYTPNPGFVGTDTFQYRAVDSDGAFSGIATVTVNVGDVNDPPLNSVPTAQQTDEDTLLVFSGVFGNALSVSDPDPTTGEVEITLAVTRGTLTLGSTAGLSSVIGDGTAGVTAVGTIPGVIAALDGLAYAPSLNTFGPDTLTFTTDDRDLVLPGGPMSDTDTVAITVNPVNDRPSATGDQYSTLMYTTLSVGGSGVLINDTDVEGSTLSAILLTAPSHGTLSLQPDGRFLYHPAADFYGTDAFTYAASDAQGASSDPVTVWITVTLVTNDLPAGYCSASVGVRPTGEVLHPALLAAACALLAVLLRRRV